MRKTQLEKGGVVQCSAHMQASGFAASASAQAGLEPALTAPSPTTGQPKHHAVLERSIRERAGGLAPEKDTPGFESQPPFLLAQ